jgi:hypothetical protein
MWCWGRKDIESWISWESWGDKDSYKEIELVKKFMQEWENE